MQEGKSDEDGVNSSFACTRDVCNGLHDNDEIVDYTDFGVI